MATGPRTNTGCLEDSPPHSFCNPCNITDRTAQPVAHELTQPDKNHYGFARRQLKAGSARRERNPLLQVHPTRNTICWVRL